jgi:hypothetical protein
MMPWDIVLDRLRQSGLDPRYEDYVENYGLYAVGEHRIPDDRRFRCTRGFARLDGAEVELIAFPSEDEALDFLALVEREGGWTRQEKLLVRVSNANPRVEGAIRDILATS